MTSSSSARPSRRPTRGRGAAQGRPKAGAGRQKSAPVARPQEFTMPEPLTPALPPVAAFEDMDMPEALLKTLAAQGVTEPFPIQAATLPNSLAGRDLLGRGRTGSGKTLAFGLALLARTAGHRSQPKQPLALVLVPTRELAQQVTDALAPYATAVNLRIATVVGGMSINRQSGALRRGAEVLVATPGRLKDLIDRGDADLSQVGITVLDEADQMTDMGFMPQVTALLKQVRADGQTMLFSATLDKNIDKLVKMFLHDPVAFSVDPSAGAVSTMEHHVLYVMDETDKKAVATRIAARDGRVIMFVDTKRGVDRMVKKLLADGVRASGLHGGRSQPQRNRTLDWFKTGEVTALVATNVAARGIHIDDLDLVVNVDPPTDHKDYLHRGGRTARAGESGSVVTLVLPDQKRDMTRLMSDAGISPRTAQIKSSDAELSRLTGAKEPSGIPVVLDVPQPTAPKPRNGSGSGSGSGSRRRSGGPRTGSATGGAPAAGGRGHRSGGGASGQAPAASGSGQARRGGQGGGGATGSGERGRRTGGGATGGAAAASARSRVGSAGQGRRRAV
ncbi:DEAD/DEAH box helicase [Streptomyces sp. MB09-01]|uniref:DEAD/DEAH box helicase n=1 Tax=Streptomyces sp. MB09-01 TaxID=3028666 RepID=UPI0029A57024|nr:DEAD/DEAH box helicase [Streptomyces sp. MB09-01]MDX3535247.1 DEAD/DEAH box helicase [Streptomyces sp. MB09-01]